MHLYRDIGVANWLMTCCAAGLLAVAAPAARAAGDDADANAVAFASDEALALSDEDVDVVSNPNCTPTKTFPGDLCTQTGSVVVNKKTGLIAAIEYNLNTCKEISAGTWKPIKKPKDGKLSQGLVKGTISGCGTKKFNFQGLFYTGTKVGKDVFTSEWTSPDFPKKCKTCKDGLDDTLTVKK